MHNLFKIRGYPSVTIVQAILKNCSFYYTYIPIREIVDPSKGYRVKPNFVKLRVTDNVTGQVKVNKYRHFIAINLYVKKRHLEHIHTAVAGDC